jgi:hypothetical protein
MLFKFRFSKTTHSVNQTVCLSKKRNRQFNNKVLRNVGSVIENVMMIEILPQDDVNQAICLSKKRNKFDESTEGLLEKNQELIDKANIIKELATHQGLTEIYKEVFSEFDKLQQFITECKHVGLFENGTLLGGASYKMIMKNNIVMMDLILIGVKQEKQRNGEGTKLMNYLKDICRKIVIWSDNKAVGFYTRQTFFKNEELGKALSEITCVTSRSQFMYHSLEFKEIEILIGDLSKSKFEIAPMTDHEKLIFKESLLGAILTQRLTFSDDLINPVGTKNDKIKKLSKRNEEVFSKFKDKSRAFENGPFKIVFQNEIGYCVVTTNEINAFTLIAEYSGEITPWSNDLDNDSIMNYTGDLVINPRKFANLAKYVSGINNLIEEENVKTIKFSHSGTVHILLYASRPIKKNEILKYDYRGDYNASDFVNLTSNYS